jgi:hypothetical protein
MPIDFNPIGLNIELPADIALLNPPYTNITGQDPTNLMNQLNPSRIPVFGSPGYVDGLMIAVDGTFQPHTLAAPSGCRINGTNYYVTSHIGAGSFGTVGSVEDDAGNEYIIKFQLIRDEVTFFKCIKEAINNVLWQSVYPDFINGIFHIVLQFRSTGEPYAIVFLLEKKIMTLENAIAAIGNPVAYPADYVQDPTIPLVDVLGVPYTVPQNIIGKDLKSLLCRLAINLRGIIDMLGGNHGDLKADNIMQGADGNFSLIDFGFSRSEFSVDGINIIIECENLFNSNISESKDMTQLIWRLYNIPSVRGCSIDPILQGILTFDNPVIAAPFLPFNPSWYSRDVYGLPNHQIGPTINPPATDILRNIYVVLNSYENANGAINVVGLQVCPPVVEEPVINHMIEIDGGSRRKYKNRKRRYTRKYAKKRQIIRRDQGQGQGQKGRRTRRASSSLH